jgi:hypothetical protein
MVNIPDIIHACSPIAAPILGFGESYFSDEFSAFGKKFNGRRMARRFLIASVALLTTDKILQALATHAAQDAAGAATLCTITARSVLLYALPDATRNNKNVRRAVAASAFAVGTAASLAGQLYSAGHIDALPTLFSTGGLMFGCLMDFQRKQENAVRFLIMAGSSWLTYGCITHTPAIIAKTLAVDIIGANVNLYRNFARSRYEGTPLQKMRAYWKDTVCEVASAGSSHAKRSVAFLVSHVSHRPPSAKL